MVEQQPSPPRRNWRSQEELTLPPILSASRDAFYESGYHGTTVRDIARRLGVTVPALYYHYENKEALLLSILDASIEHLTRLCEAAVRDAGDSPVDRFLNVVECITLYEATAKRTAMIDHEMRLLSPDLRSLYAGKRRRVEDMLLDAVRDGIATGQFDAADAKDTTRAILGMLQAIPMWYDPAGPITPTDLARRYLDICAHTVGAPAALVGQLRKKRRSRRDAVQGAAR
ncbi:TetR/AcrR family transcriptional regulator [Nocardioides ginkgobilobae]